MNAIKKEGFGMKLLFCLLLYFTSYIFYKLFAFKNKEFSA